MLASSLVANAKAQQTQSPSQRRSSTSMSNNSSPSSSPRHSRSPSNSLITPGNSPEAELPLWVRQQMIAFFSWANSFLAARDLTLEKLSDLSDGVLLIQLFEAIETSHHKHSVASYEHDASNVTSEAAAGQLPVVPSTPAFKHYNLHPKNAWAKIENIELVLEKFKARGCPLVGITAQAVNEGHVKACLGLLWQFVLADLNDVTGQEHSISKSDFSASGRLKDAPVRETEIESLPILSTNASTSLQSPNTVNSGTGAKDRMLRWIEMNVNASSTSPQIAIKGFASLADGRALVRLLNFICPDAIDEESTTHMDANSRLQLVVDTANSKCGIPPALDVSAFAAEPERTDPLALLTYLSHFRTFGVRGRALKASSEERTSKSLTSTPSLDAPTAAGSEVSKRTHSKADSATGQDISAMITAAQATTNKIQQDLATRSSRSSSSTLSTPPLSPASSTVNSSNITSSTLKESSNAYTRLMDDHQALQKQHEFSVDEYEKQLLKQREQVATDRAEAQLTAEKIAQLQKALEQALQSTTLLERERDELCTQLNSLQSSQRANAARAEELEAKLGASQASSSQVEQTASNIQAENVKALREELERTIKENESTMQKLKQKVLDEQEANEQLRLHYELRLSAEGTSAASAQQETQRQLQELQAVLAVQLSTAHDTAIKQEASERALQSLRESNEESSKRAAQMAEHMARLQADKDTLAHTLKEELTTRAHDSASPTTSSRSEREWKDLEERHAFELRQLERENQTSISALQNQLKSLQSSLQASERQQQSHFQSDSARVHELEERASVATSELAQFKLQSRASQARSEQAILELTSKLQQLKREEERSAQKLVEARGKLSEQRNEMAEAKSLKSQRAQIEAKLSEERKKNRELLERIETIKRNKAVSSTSEPDSTSNSSAQSASRSSSRSSSPLRTGNTEAGAKRNGSVHISVAGSRTESRASSPTSRGTRTGAIEPQPLLLDKLSIAPSVESTRNVVVAPQTSGTFLLHLRVAVLVLLLLVIFRMFSPDAFRSAWLL